MRLSFHGGMCCGIKHIFELSTDPEAMIEALPELKHPNNSDIAYDFTDQEERFFDETAPKETRTQRLDRYLAFLQRKRPYGIVEITLITTSPVYNQSKWIPVIQERGFVEVTPPGGVYNSNSGNHVRVFHLYMGHK